MIKDAYDYYWYSLKRLWIGIVNITIVENKIMKIPVIMDLLILRLILSIVLIQVLR